MEHVNRPQIGPKQSCPLCHDVLRNGGALVACEACETLYHEGCFEEFGGCAVLGCKHHDATRVQPEASLAKPGGRPALGPHSTRRRS